MSEVVKLLLRGVDYSRYIDIGSVQATNNVVKTQDNMSFTIYLDRNAVVPLNATPAFGNFLRPAAGMEVVWGRFDSTTGAEISREFGGVMTQVHETSEGSTLIYSCDAQSYLRWFDRRLVNGFYQQQLAETTIKQIVSKHCPGFTTTNVYAPLMVVAQYFEYQRPSNAVKMICDQLGFGFYIDYYRGLHTYRFEEFPSPLPGNILDVDNDFVNYGDLELTEDSENVFNSFIVRGYKVRAPQSYTLRFKGDGTTTSWSLGYRFSSAKGDSLVNINGVNFPVVRDILDGLPGQATDPTKAYAHWTQHQLRFVNPPANGAIIEFTGYPLINRTKPGRDDESVDYMNALESSPASDGVYEWAEIDKSLTQSTENAVQSKIELMAIKYGFPTLAGSFTSFTSGWRAGQMFRMVSSFRMKGLLTQDKRYYVYRISKRWIQPTHSGEVPIQYTIEFADKPYLI